VRVRHVLIILLVVSALTACESTMPAAELPQAPSLPTVTPEPVGLMPTQTPVPVPTRTPVPSPVADDSRGPVTPVMAELNLSGKQYGTLGDPNAPLTMIEFSDFG
jgi:protein-disulfide isomerase